MAGPHLPSLTQPRSEVERRLRERIDQAKAILPGRIQLVEELTKAQERERKWYAYNTEMLRAMFTSNAYAVEYANSRKSLNFDADRYHNPDLRPFEIRMIENIQSQVASLDSIMARLELLRENTATPAAQSAVVARDLSKVFVVHGRDTAPRDAVARVLGQFGITPIILTEQANRGGTVIEKVEANSEVGFAVVLLTPDDEGYLKGEKPQPRARQNVMLELGYFIGLLGRKYVCAFNCGGVEIPSDFAGVIAEEFDAGGGWRTRLAIELRAAGFNIDLNKLLPS